MNGKDALDPRNLTFSHAYGYKELPQPLKLGELGMEARTRLWSLLYQHVSFRSSYTVSGNWGAILVSLQLNFRGLPLDELDISIKGVVRIYKPIIMDVPFHEVFDLLLLIMRHPKCPHGFVDSVALIFERSRLAYVVDKKTL